MPAVLAASKTVAPFSTSTVLPSIITLTFPIKDYTSLLKTIIL